MSTHLSELLGATEPLFSMSIKQMEKASGSKAADVKLIAEIVTKVQEKTKELGLDPADTSGEELHWALQNLTWIHDKHLAGIIGCPDPTDVKTLIPLIIKAVKKAGIPKKAWVLKRSSFKKLLRDNPPKKIMKILGYNSADSMLKRENIAEIAIALRFAETPAWLSKFNKGYKTLQPSDFESHEVEIIQLPHEKWAASAENFIRERRQIVANVKELGVIGILPITLKVVPGLTLATMPLILHYINEVRLHSSFFKLQQVKPNFGKIISETLESDASKVAVMAGSHVHWRVIQRFYGQGSRHPEIFEPHVQPEDMLWGKVEDYMFKIDPELKFWKGLDYVLVMSGTSVISFNLLDNSQSGFIGADYAHRMINHGRNSLWNELFIRYMGESILEDQVLRQLDTNMVAPERLKI